MNNKFKIRCYLFLWLSLLLLGLNSYAHPRIHTKSSKNQFVDYKAKAIALDKAINTNFYIPDSVYYREQAKGQVSEKPVSYLWSLCAMLQAAEQMERLFPKRRYMDKVYQVIEKYNDPSPPSPGYDSYPSLIKKEDRYYDDNQWIAIAAMDAYHRDNRPRDLMMGLKIYQFMMTGLDSVSGGGFYWREADYLTKNTCSNGPAIILLLQLYKVKKQKKFLEKALEVYHWTIKHLKAPDNLYYDNINVQTGKIAKQKYSYNTGTMLQANVYLYEITKEQHYLQEANKIAAAAESYFLATGKFRDDYWFNAVLLRGLEHLYRYSHDNHYIKAFARCTQTALHNNMNNLGLMGRDKNVNLVGQAGMLEILLRLAWLQQKGDL